MNNLTSEYEKLLRYLESQTPVTATQQDKTKFKKVDTLKAAREKFETKKKVKKDRKEKVSESTKKIIEESKIDDFIDLPSTHKGKLPSKGFNVSQFESLMRAKLIEEYKTRQSYERPYISCSELYNCMRQNYYMRKRYQIDVSAQYRFSYLYLIQKVGNTIHSVFQDLYNFTEIEKTIVSEKYKVKGRVDALKEQNLYELKSIDPDKFNGRYVHEHYLQCVIYAHILSEEYDYPISNISIIYILRNLKNIYVFDLDINDELAVKHLQRAPVLLQALDSNIVPEPAGATKEQCKYCLYKKYCKKDKYEKIIPPFLKIKESKEENHKKAVFLLS